MATNTGEFGFRISCLAHNINLTISNGLNLWNKKKLESSDGFILTSRSFYSYAVSRCSI